MPSFLFYVYVRFALICVKGNREVLSSRVGVFLDNSCRAKSESKVLAPKKQKCKNLMRQKSKKRKSRKRIFVQKKIKKEKTSLQLLSRWWCRSCCLHILYTR